MKSNNKISKRELFVKFSGPILFSVFFALLCVGIFKFLPEDAPINSEYVVSNKQDNSDEEEWQKSILVNPSDYHVKVVEHKTQKTDAGLELYRSALSKSSVIWFYNQITGNQDVTLAILTAADANDIPLSLAFALAYTESRYKVTAVNSNTNKSIDRGLFQLNNRSFPQLKEEEFQKEEFHIEDLENPNKDFYVKLNAKNDIIELYDSSTDRLIETISGTELGELVKKLNMASGIFVNKRV